jgi:hypothetical protein
MQLRATYEVRNHSRKWLTIHGKFSLIVTAQISYSIVHAIGDFRHFV